MMLGIKLITRAHRLMVDDSHDNFPHPGIWFLYSQFRVIRGCHVKRVRVQIRFIHLLEIGFLLILQY